MFSKLTTGIAAVAFSAALCCGLEARAGEGCCGEKAGGGAVADKPAEKAVEKKTEQCSLAECDTKRTAATEAALGKLAAPAPKLSDADAKALADACTKLGATCPMGKAFTSAIPAIVEGLEAIQALDAAVASNKLPADCTTPDGKCAFCVEAGKHMPEDAKKAMELSFKAFDRAHKVALKLAERAAAFKAVGAEAAPKPAGSPAAVPSKETFAQLAAKVEAAAKAIAAGQEKFKALPEADKKVIHESMAAIDKVTPGSFDAMMGGWGALFAELDLARMSLSIFENKATFMKDPKFVDGLSPNAKNAMALFAGRAQLAYALGGIADAACASGCDEGGCGASKGAPASSGCEKKPAATN